MGNMNIKNMGLGPLSEYGQRRCDW